jgi:hypothetical protein
MATVDLQWEGTGQEQPELIVLIMTLSEYQVGR